MSSVVISGDTSGAITVAAPAVSGTNTLTLQAATATSAVNTLATAVASTSGTSIEFTTIPSWAKRITFMLYGVSTNSTNNFLVQVGNTSFVTTGYVSGCQQSTAYTASTDGLIILTSNAAASAMSGMVILTNVTGNTWVSMSNINKPSSILVAGAGNIALAGTLDRIRLIASSTGAPADTFDAGSINILYEG